MNRGGVHTQSQFSPSAIAKNAFYTVIGFTMFPTHTMARTLSVAPLQRYRQLTAVSNAIPTIPTATLYPIRRHDFHSSALLEKSPFLAGLTASRACPIFPPASISQSFGRSTFPISWMLPHYHLHIGIGRTMSTNLQSTIWKLSIQKMMKENRSYRRFNALTNIREVGNKGEEILYETLDQLKKDGLIRDYQEQPTLRSGQCPDAIVELLCGRKMVVDSKATRTSQFETKGAFVRNYKDMMMKFAKKDYAANVPNPLEYVVVFNPFHFDVETSFSTLHAIASENGLKLVSPETLRSLICSINKEHAKAETEMFQVECSPAAQEE